MDNQIKIGKYVLENLTTGMYEDSKIVYREYIQNSADQIDKAIEYNLFPNQKLFIDININKSKRTISIKDNATGIKLSEVHEKLANVADSTKERGVDKGFRGIGRLGGLAYCDTLKFITSFEGENKKTVMTWDACEVRKLINDKENSMSIQEILQKVIKYEYINEDLNSHYFEVEMIGVRSENYALLDIDEVREYISWNCPVPIDYSFHFRSEINKKAKELDQPIDEYCIYLNGNDIHKLYAEALYDTNGKYYDEIYNVAFEEFKDEKGELIAWSWIGISGFEKNIPTKNNSSKGIRLRKENIQIGNAHTLDKFFSETRGNGYFVGEVHAVHKDLIPNARRDYFNETETSVLFEKLFKKYTTSLKNIYYNANDYKNAIKAINTFNQAQKEAPKLFIDENEKNEYENKTKEQEKKAKQAEIKLQNLRNKMEPNEKLLTAMDKAYIIEDIIPSKDNISNAGTNKEKKKAKQQFLTSELSKLNNGERKVVEKIYKILRDNLPKDLSTELINKIQSELKL